MQLGARQRHALAVVAVDHKDQLRSVGRTHRTCGRQVVRPARAQRRLAANVPQHKLEVLVFKCLCVGPNRRRGRHDRSERHFVHQRGFAWVSGAHAPALSRLHSAPHHVP